ncbi:HAD family hydrolase [Puniceicoccus vermicola]|uniref:Haloacid dehalogenase-like hydrolase n=1 Tax=Puniceicoccus vermicola TaxID=388746 RepID=A0A7X1AZH6_9BACT|nr:haloacid dehalogenase-like hydrolase [Puniceicoccus vermicola]MBC2602828.1 haloacid dehalogenase-like hydrolase [Puniceicoccus vermicola]
MAESNLHGQTVIACIWDFDKTLIPGYMQSPLFEAYGIDEKTFWNEVNELPELYARQGCHVSKDTVYLNHLLSYVKNGPLKGLSNRKLRELGRELRFYPGLPEFFKTIKNFVSGDPFFQKHGVTIEHYIISTGLAEMIRGSSIAPYVDGIFGCEFIEKPFPPGYGSQKELELVEGGEVSQIGVMVDNTIKTRFVFEINKGTNKDPSIDVNANILPGDRRIPIRNMIYLADGPSDVPVFSVVRRSGGLTFAVYDPESEAEFAQNDSLLQAGRIDSYGPADYRESSSTNMWLRMHIRQIAGRICEEKRQAMASRVKEPPRHLHKEVPPSPPMDLQGKLFTEGDSQSSEQ